MVKEYYIPESSELGQLLLDMSATPGSLYDRRITKAELLENLTYLIDSARETKNNIKSAEYMKQYLANGDEDDWYDGGVKKMTFNDMVKRQIAKNNGISEENINIEAVTDGMLEIATRMYDHNIEVKDYIRNLEVIGDAMTEWQNKNHQIPVDDWTHTSDTLDAVFERLREKFYQARPEYKEWADRIFGE